MYFSVVVPVYNVEKYLRECVDSILSQTFEDFELILVDDGSKDTSGDICDEYAVKDKRVKVIHKENGGQSTARNVGIDAACGEFAVFLDSDDLICDNNFFSDVKSAVEENTDIVVFRYCKYYEDKRVDGCGIDLSGVASTNKVDFLRELVKRDAFFCSCWSKCTRMRILKDNGIRFDEKLSCEDMDWYYNVVLKASAFKVIDKPFVYYRQRSNSVTSSFKKKSITDYIYTVETWNEKLNAIEDSEEKSVMLSSLAKLYCNLLIAYSRHTKELKDCKKKIFSFKHLLSYNLNPRVKKISMFAKAFGLGITCTVLNVLGKMR
ncbi:MAG: glycosyltransferase [Clostridia bacterium]|nr:glycosyltransferase [Clostridia bacterium]